MTYDPRTETGIPTEQVGSLPRAGKAADRVRRLRRGEDRRRTTWRRSRTRLSATRSPSWRPLARRSSPTASSAGRALRPTRSPTPSPAPGSPRHLGPGGQYFAIFADGHNRQLPRLTGGPFRYKTYAADTLAKSIPFANRPMKQAVIAPSMLALLYPPAEEIPGYTSEQFEADLVDECEKDIRRAFEVGAARVSIDFTEGRLATRADPRNPWTARRHARRTSSS